jgi:predicted phosphodiesterase
MRSLQHATLTLNELMAIANTIVLPTLGESSIRIELNHILSARQEAAASGIEESWEGDCIVHEGDLTIHGDFSTRTQPACSLLIVTGNLTVSGLLEITLDPDALVIVMGDLHADRLINMGFLYVHGHVLVNREALWLDNDATSLIHGNLSAPFLFTQYHTVNIGGDVLGDLILGDYDRFESATAHPFICYDDDEHQDMLVESLPEEIFSIERYDEEEWCIEYVDSPVLSDLVRQGKPILKSRV